MDRIKIPRYAEKNAKKGLRLRRELFEEGDRPALTKTEAQEKGIESGLSRARQLSRGGSLSREDAESIESFLSRNVPRRGSRKDDVNDLLWGDDDSDRFEMYLERKLGRD